MEHTRTFEHDGKRYEIKGKYNTIHETTTVFVNLYEPEEQTGNEVKKIEGEVVHFNKTGLEDGDITGLRMIDKAIDFIENLQEDLKEQLQEEIEEKESKQVFTYRTWTGKKRTRADSIEEAAEYFSEKYDVDATPENVEKVEADGDNKSSMREQEDQFLQNSGKKQDGVICGECGKRPDDCGCGDEQMIVPKLVKA